VLFAGARSSRELQIIELLGYKGALEVSTQDGSSGYRGLVTGLLERERGALEGYAFINCGPELFLAKACSIQKQAGSPSIRCLMERYMKCGVGLCGSCSLEGTASVWMVPALKRYGWKVFPTLDDS